MTRIDLDIRSESNGASFLGAGFVALDIVEGEFTTFASTGGSCGNVVSILSWLGWDTRIAGRLKDDTAGQFIWSHLRRIGVDVSNLSLEEKGVSPIVIQKFVETAAGDRAHRFSLTCPDCKGWLPRYRAMTLKHADRFIEANLPPRAYYFDRANPANLRLAQWARDAGAVIIFEPSSVSEERHFERAIDLCHVLKFSSDRLGHVPDLAEAKAPSIIIHTHGRDGLSVRWKRRWSKLPAFEAPVFRDAAGSGDWCSAGFIHKVASQGVKGLTDLRKDGLEQALRFGQALAAVNCGYEGAQSAMDFLDQKAFNRLLRLLVQGEINNDSWTSLSQQDDRSPPEGLCFSCVVGKSEDEERRVG